MIKRVTQGSKQYKYAIKKLSIGVVSVATGASILLYSPQVMAQESSPETGVTQTQVEHEKQATEQADSVVNEAVNASAGLTPESSEKRTEAVGDSSQATEPQLSTNQADASQADKISESAKPLATDAAAKAPAISDNHLRLHLKALPKDQSLDSLGLWVWDDVDQPSKDWPNGAIPLATAKKDDYGYYLDVKLAEKQRQQVSYLINNKAGENLSKDQHISLFTPRMNEVWIDENYHAHAYRPLKKGYLRINYHNQSGHYDNLAVWTFKDVKTPTTDWPNGLDLSHKGPYGAYVDVPLKEGAKEIGFLILDKSKSGDAIKVQPKDYLFKDLDNHTQIFVKDTDPKVYNNPYYIDQVSLKGAEQTTPNEIKAIFTTLDGLDEDTVKQKIKITDKAGKAVAIDELTLDKDKSVMTLKGDFKAQGAVYTVTFGEVSQVARQSCN